MSIVEVLRTIAEEERLQESWGEPVDITEFMTDSAGFFNTNGLGSFTQIYDREDGRFRPVYQNESDLKLIRAMSWLLVEKVPMAQAWVNRLLDYTVGTGFDWTINCGEGRLSNAVQSYVREAMDLSKWSSELERESYVREIADGEFLGELVYDDGQCLLVAREADELTEPANKRALEEWLGIDSYVPSWTFGVLTKKNLPERHIGYHLVRSLDGTDWDYVPARNVVFWKRNVRSRAKRGFSDFYKPHLYLLRADRVLTNTAEGAATQAAIAYIVEHKDGTQRQANGIVSRFAPLTGKVDPLTGLAQRRRRMLPGTRLDVPEGQSYKAGLLGSNNSDIYVQVMEAALRLAGTVHGFPEGMLTGSYENANLASALVAEGPFMQGRQAEQVQRAERMREMLLKIIRVGAEKGRFRHEGIDGWDALKDRITVEVIPARILPRNVMELTQALKLQKDAGWVSDKTAINELGRDIDVETANGLKVGQAPAQPGAPGQGGKPGAPGQGPQAGPGEGGNVSSAGPTWLGLSRIQWQRNRRAITDVLTDFAAGKTRRTVAKVLLRSIGMPEADIETMLKDAADGQIDSLPPEQMESLTEAERKTLGRPFRTPGGPKKFAVYVKNQKGNVVKVTFGDPKMRIQRDKPGRRKGFRARHNCDDPGPRWKARYWSCRFWSKPSVSKLLKESIEGCIPWDGRTFVREAWLLKVNPRLLEVKDGDGDGLVDDGKPSERPVSDSDKKLKKVAKSKSVSVARDDSQFRTKYQSFKEQSTKLDEERIALRQKLKAAKTHEATVELSKQLHELEQKSDANRWNAATEYGTFHAENPELYKKLRDEQLNQSQQLERENFAIQLKWADEVRMRPGVEVSTSNLSMGSSYYDPQSFDPEAASKYTEKNSLRTIARYKSQLSQLSGADHEKIKSKVYQAYYGEPESISEAVLGDGSVNVPAKVQKGGADSKLKSFMQASAVAVQVDPKNLASIAEKGVLSASEGGKKGVGSRKTGDAKKRYHDIRRGREEELFGIPNKPEQSRPVYGLIDNPARLLSGTVWAASNYGAAQVVLKPGVKSRTSYTIGDSLDDYRYGGITGAVNDPTDHSSVPPKGFYQNPADADKNPSTTKAGATAGEFRVIVRSEGGTREKESTPQYIEAQIHGGIAPSDIAEVRVPRGLTAPSAMKKLQKAGIAVREIPPPPIENFYNLIPDWEKIGND